MTTPVLAITPGDPAGIGPEILLRLLPTLPPEARLLLVGDPTLLARSAAQCEVEAPTLPTVDTPAAIDAQTPVAWWAGASRIAAPVPVGEIDAEAGRVSHAWVIEAATLAVAGKVAGLVTGPIHKEAWARAGVARTGHTEVLRDHAGVPAVCMVLAGGRLWTGLATTHIALGAVPGSLSHDDLVATLRQLHEGLPRYLGRAAPRIGVCGLNPHAGEGGLYGSEEIRVIAPAIETARGLGIDVSGPWPADAVIPQAVAGRYDAVLAMYHDQSLPVVKSLAPRTAVNLTLGLPYIRTSVDHGTAFDIAGQGIATPESLTEALTLARQAAVLSVDVPHSG